MNLNDVLWSLTEIHEPYSYSYYSLNFVLSMDSFPAYNI